MISKDTFYRMFFLEKADKFFRFIEDAKKFSIEDFYNKYHKIIGHPYYMMRNYKKPQNGYLSYLDFDRLKPQINNEDFLFSLFAESINFMASVHWSGSYIDKQVTGVRRLLKTKLNEKEISYDKKKYKEQLVSLELNKKHYGNVLETGYKFLLLNEELNKKYDYELGYIIRRSALKIPYEIPDKNIYFFVVPKGKVTDFVGYKSDTFEIYGSELFENPKLVEEMNQYCNRFNNSNLPYDIDDKWHYIAKKIEDGTYPKKDAKGNLILKPNS